MKKLSVLALMTGLILALPAWAQEAPPELPDPLKNLTAEGAQVRYLGREHGLDSWLTVKGGQEQYFYVLPDRSAFIMGLLFDNTGKLVTVEQVQRLQQGGETILDEMTSKAPPKEEFTIKSPSEQLFTNIEESNWIVLGLPTAPIVYAFIDPQCPHCHAFINDLRTKKLLETGKVQLRMIPVGFREETIAQAAFLMATPNPEERWLRHMSGDKDALPAKSEINQQGVQRNLAIMQSWKFDVTPMIVYRAKDGTVKLVRGRPQDPEGLVADLPQGSPAPTP